MRSFLAGSYSVETFFRGCCTCRVTRRTRGGATDAEESRIHEKAASQWTKEERRGDTRGGAGGGEDVIAS